MQDFTHGDAIINIYGRSGSAFAEDADLTVAAAAAEWNLTASRRRTRPL